MKKLFSVLFSIAFLLVFVSFFSQKTFAMLPTDGGGNATSLACRNALGGVCWNDVGTPGLNTTGITNYLYNCNHYGAPTSSTYCVSGCKINSSGEDACNPPLHYTCKDTPGQDCIPTQTCEAFDPTLTTGVGSCPPLGSKLSCCKSAPAPSCTVNWGTFPSTITGSQTPAAIVTFTSNFGIHNTEVYVAPEGNRINFPADASIDDNPQPINPTAVTPGSHTLKAYLDNSAGIGVECSPEKTFTVVAAPPPPPVAPPPPPAPPTCTAKTGVWGACTGVNACSKTGSRTRTNTNTNCTTVNETDSSCALTPASTCNTPAAPVINPATCDATTPTSEKITWTKDPNTTESLLYYCDKTKAAANNVSCTRDAHPSNKTDGSEAAQAGWYSLPGNAASVSPADLTGLIVGDEYTAFVRAYNGNHVTSTLHTDNALPDITFTAGSCGTPAPTPGLALVIGLDGIGTTGDQVNADWTTKTNTAIINGQSVTNPVAGSNQTPTTPTRLVTLTLVSGGTPITVTGNVTFVPSGTNVGKYTGTIPYGTAVKAGTYTVKVTIDGHLTKLVPGTVTVVNINTTATIAPVNLVTGDIATTNGLTINDYNILLSCISDSDYRDLDGHAACNANTAYKVRADTEDNGVIDKFDYNLFLREFKMIQAGD